MRVRWFLASVFAALWLFTSLAATSAELHHCLHEDAPAGDHQCLFTKLAEGQFVEAPSAQISVSIPLADSPLEQRSLVATPSSGDSFLPPGRGPPVL